MSKIRAHGTKSTCSAHTRCTTHSSCCHTKLPWPGSAHHPGSSRTPRRVYPSLPVQVSPGREPRVGQECTRGSTLTPRHERTSAGGFLPAADFLLRREKESDRKRQGRESWPLDTVPGGASAPAPSQITRGSSLLKRVMTSQQQPYLFTCL